jgi:uncharacterized membrane protein YsdA (DUF1294 family)
VIYLDKIFVAYLLFIQIIAIAVTVSDKKRSIKRRRRISENSLMLVAILGGSVSMYITMIFIRHKTKHLKFMLFLPLITVVQIFLLYLIIKFL